MRYLKNYNTFILESYLSYSSEDLTTLVGLDLPEKHDGDFDCSNNKLISLIGSPKEISGDFICTYNKITNLDDIEINVGGDFCCYENDWKKPIPYKYMIKYNLHPLQFYGDDYKWVYKIRQFNKFGSFDFQKEFLEREPENYLDLKPIGYAKGIEELFPHLFDMDELGLLD